MSFRNAILKGSGELIRAAMRSPNFITGVAGWIIRKDGSVEFSNAQIRGEIIANDGFATGIAGDNEARVEIRDVAGGDIEFFAAGETNLAGRIRALENTSKSFFIALEGHDAHATQGRGRILLWGSETPATADNEARMDIEGEGYVRVLATGRIELAGADIYFPSLDTSATAGQPLHYNASTGQIFRHVP